MLKSAPEESAPFRAHLVEELRRQGTLTAPAVADAFLHTPREVFVPQYYRDAGRAGWTV